jgi:uncharacterized DUF497 family protein
MAAPERITPEEVYQKLKAEKAMLVCAYEDETKDSCRIRIFSARKATRKEIKQYKG